MQVARSLRQVVTEAGPEHVLDALGRDVAGGQSQVIPDEALGVAVLDALAQAAFGALVEVIPVADGAFLNVPGLSSAARVGGGECGGRRQQFGAAAGKGFAETVTVVLSGGIDVDRFADVVAAVVGVDVEARRSVVFESSERGESVQRREGAVGLDRHVCDRGVAVTTHASAPEAFEAHVKLLGEDGNAERAADAAADFGVVVGVGDGIGGRGAGRCARIVKDAVAEETADAEDFIVAPARIEGDLGDEIRSRVDGVGGQRRRDHWRASGGCNKSSGVDGCGAGAGSGRTVAGCPVIKTAVGAWLAPQIGCAGVEVDRTARSENLRILSRYADGKLR